MTRDATQNIENEMDDARQSPYLNIKEAGAFLRREKRTLDNMRWMGTGSQFRKHGGKILYRVDEMK